MGKTLLTLETIVPDRDCVEIDGAKYGIRFMNELSISAASKMRQLSQEIVGLKIGAETSEADAKKLEDYADTVLDVILVDLPDETRKRLTLLQKFQIVTAFNGVNANRAMAGTQEQGGSPSTSENSSRASEGSTEAH